jgi:hypothetical protein
MEADEFVSASNASDVAKAMAGYNFGRSKNMLSKRAFDAWVAKDKTQKRAKTFSADITDINGDDIDDILVYKTDRDGSKHLRFINGWHLTRGDYPMRNKWSQDPDGFYKKYRDYVQESYQPSFDAKGRVTNANTELEDLNKFWVSKGFKSTTLKDKSPIRMIGEAFKPIYEEAVPQGSRTGRMSYISLLGGFYTQFLNSPYGQKLIKQAIDALTEDGYDINIKTYKGVKSERSVKEKIAYIKRSKQFTSLMRNFLSQAFEDDNFVNTFNEAVDAYIKSVEE